MALPLSLFLISILCYSFPSSSSQTTLKLTLNPILNHHIPPSQQSGSQDPFIHTLNYLASSSVARAQFLKNPKKSTPVFNSPLSPKSYGAYSVSLSFGSPAQKLPLVFDTGSSLVWFPCTKRYKCADCDFLTGNETSIVKFIPKSSSSVKLLGCGNKKCGFAFGSRNPVKCNGENDLCPVYLVQYGSGSTSGLLLSETLNFPQGDVTDFVVGCSIVSKRQPSGIAGFGRSPASLPAQMGLKKFSYCLVSHRYDDLPVSSELVLIRDGEDTGITGLSYTKFRKNPVVSGRSFNEYYYLNLRKITVGGKTVRIPYGYLVPGNDGNGGTIIDSGTTFTFMDDHVHNLVAKEFESQMSKYRRAFDTEKDSGLRPCFISNPEPPKLPELMFHFKGGAKLALPMADYFSVLGDTGVLCMTIVSNARNGSGQGLGPSILIGNYQQQNIYLEYDLEKGRLGFKNQICK